MTENYPGVSWLGRAFLRVYNRYHGRRTRRLDVEQIWAESAHRGPVEDSIRDPHLNAALEAIVGSINRIADLSPFGRLTLERQLIDFLATHRRISRLTATPGPVAPVLFIIGPPRSGTTLLQRLLAEDPRARSLRPWELSNPIPAPRAAEYLTDDRIGRARKQMRVMRLLAPGLLEMHPMDTALPEEDVAILQRGFLTATWCGLLGSDPQFEEWVMANGDANAEAAYRYHRRELGYLQSDFSPTHWVLKSPGHMFGLRALLKTYPDAWILNTYREPTEWVSSLCQLQWLYQSSIRRTDATALGPEVLRWWGQGIDGMIALRKQHPGRFIDIDYRETVASPLDTIRRIYEHTGLAYDDVCERRMHDHLAREQFLKHKTGTYKLEHFGVDRAAVNERFAGYRQEFGLSSIKP